MKTTRHERSHGRDETRPSTTRLDPQGGGPRSVVAGQSRERFWKLAAAGLLVGAAVLAYQLWQTRTSERHYAELTRAAVAEMQAQAKGCGNALVARHVVVTSIW